MADKDRYAGAGGEQLDGRIENFLGLNHHLPLFLGRAVFHEGVDVGDDVEGNLLGKSLRLDLVIDVDALGLGPQLVHGRLATAGHRLIGRTVHALDLGTIMDRLERHHQLDGRTVRVGNDALLGHTIERFRVHFRYDQGDIRVHAPGRGVVDDNGARSRDFRRPFARRIATG